MKKAGGVVGGVGVRSTDSLVGRDEELSRLRAGLDDARAGRGGLFLVSGEAGIGKTSLVETLMNVATPEAPVFWGRCWESGGAPPYWPWVQILRPIVDATGDQLRRRLERVLAKVAQLDPSVTRRSPVAAPLSPPGVVEARSELFDATAVLLETVARDRGGVVVALDDLHAADEPSMLLLHFVARQVSRSHLLVVGTYRDAEMAASPKRRRVLSRIAAHAELLPLSGLDDDGVGSLLEQTTGDARLGFSARQVRAATDGNPLFVKEVAQLLAAGRGWRGRTAVPDEIDAVIRERLDGLDERTRRILTVASVLGREFDSTALVHLSGEASTALFDVLDEAVRAGVLKEAGLQRWSFSHALLRETLYDEMPPSERMLVHRQAGELVERLHGDDLNPWLAGLAHHFFEAAGAGDGTKALTYCAMAAGEAMASLAYEEAAALYERALEALSQSAPADDARRHELWMALAEARMACGDAVEAQVVCRRALRSARLRPSPDRLAEAAYNLSLISRTEDLADILEEAKDALPQGDTAMRARILVRLAYVRYWDAPSHWRALSELVRQGVEMARRVGDPAARHDVLVSWSLFTAPGQVDERMAIADELIRLSLDLGSSWDVANARLLRMRALFEAGDIQAVSAELDVATHEAEKAHSSVLRWAVLRPRIWLLLLGGDLDGADDMAQRMRTLGERWESPDVQWSFDAQLVAIRRQQGRFGDIERIARLAVEGAVGNPTRIHCCGVDVVLALAEQGHLDEARVDLLDMVPEGLRPESYGLPRTCCLTGLADVVWALWDEASAAAVYDALLPYAGLPAWENLAFAAPAGATDRALARLATVQGRWDEAEAFFESARQLHERLGARVFRAHDDHDHARMLLARRAPGDEARAVDLVTSARDRYRSLGMTFYHGRAEALLVELRERASARRTARGVIRREGDNWSVEFAGSVARIRDGRGVRCLVRLLANPGRELDALELVGGPDALGPRDGRGRASEVERARQSATRGIKATVERLGDMNAALGDHLRTSTRTGARCSYVSDPRAPVAWEIDDEGVALVR